MNKKAILIFCILSGIIATSCSTTLNLVVKGRPGTIISDGQKDLGMISENGETTVQLNKSAYYPFLLSKAPDSNDYIPFALDFKKNNIGYLKYSAMIGGLVVECLGGITLVVGAVTESPVFMGIGGAAMAVGVGSVLPVAFSHSSEDMYYFKYVEQVTNDDLFEKTFLEPEEK